MMYRISWVIKRHELFNTTKSKRDLITMLLNYITDKMWDEEITIDFKQQCSELNNDWFACVTYVKADKETVFNIDNLSRADIIIILANTYDRNFYSDDRIINDYHSEN